MFAALLPWLLRLAKSRAVRLILAAALLYGWAYRDGRQDCAEKHARIAAQKAEEWAEITRGAEARAYDLGLQAARSDAANDKSVEEIIKDARNEENALTQCLSGSTVNRLRNLQ